MLNSTAHRTPTAALMALPIAYGLFLLMNALIEVKEITLAAPATRILDVITPQLPETNDAVRKRPKPQRLDAATKPPPPPALSTTQADIHLPVPVIGGAAPDSLLPIRLNLPAISPVVVSSRGYQVIRPPMPVYPGKAATRGLSGSCSVAFAIDTRGKPFNVTAACTDPVFKAEAERSVLKAEFAPQLVDGQFVSVTGLEYPLEFKLAD